MAVVYLDTGAIGRVLVGEPDAPAVLSALSEFQERVASWLLRVELRRLALRESLLADADSFFAASRFSRSMRGLLSGAETIPPPTVATLAAIHLVTALRLFSAGRLDALITYDTRLADGARHHGITVLAPG